MPSRLELCLVNCTARVLPTGQVQARVPDGFQDDVDDTVEGRIIVRLLPQPTTEETNEGGRRIMRTPRRRPNLQVWSEVAQLTPERPITDFTLTGNAVVDRVHPMFLTRGEITVIAHDRSKIRCLTAPRLERLDVFTRGACVLNFRFDWIDSVRITAAADSSIVVGRVLRSAVVEGAETCAVTVHHFRGCQLQHSPCPGIDFVPSSQPNEEQEAADRGGVLITSNDSDFDAFFDEVFNILHGPLARRRTESVPLAQRWGNPPADQIAPILPIMLKASQLPDPSKDEAAEDEKTRCVSCLENKMRVMPSACGQLCLCFGCARKLKPAKCPLCRGDAGTFIVVYH